MREIALHLLDIAENSVAAQANTVDICVVEDLCADRLTASVTDNGQGMDADLLARVTDPFTTSRTTRKVGLGIPLLKAAAEACNGGMSIASTPGKGTQLTVTFQHSHIDRMPLGDLASTWLSLLVAYPYIHWLFAYQCTFASPDSGDTNHENGFKEFVFDDQPIKDELGDLPLCDPDVLGFLRETFEQGVASVRETIVDQSADLNRLLLSKPRQ